MSTILLTIVLFMLVFAALALGLVLGRGPIKGSCGGMAALADGTCEICGGDPVKCEGEATASKNARLAKESVIGQFPGKG